MYLYAHHLRTFKALSQTGLKPSSVYPGESKDPNQPSLFTAADTIADTPFYIGIAAATSRRDAAAGSSPTFYEHGNRGKVARGFETSMSSRNKLWQTVVKKRLAEHPQFKNEGKWLFHGEPKRRYDWLLETKIIAQNLSYYQAQILEFAYVDKYGLRKYGGSLTNMKPPVLPKKNHYVAGPSHPEQNAGRYEYNKRWGYARQVEYERSWIVDGPSGFYNIGARSEKFRHRHPEQFPRLGWDRGYGDITEMDEKIKKYLPTKILERLIFQSEEDAAAEAAYGET